MTALDSAAKDIGQALIPDTGPFGTLVRRLGVVATLPSGTPVTVTVTVGGVAIPNVRLLGQTTPIVGDVVVVDFNGPDPLIIGKPSMYGPSLPAEGQLVVSPGVELYHPSSTPYIDFHRGASPASDANADYNVRLINDAAERLRLYSSGSNVEFVVNNARIGPSPSGAHGAGYASFDHIGRAYTAPNNYILLAETSNTYLNAVAGGGVFLRVNNVDGAYLTSARSFRGAALGNAGTFIEGRNQNTLVNSGGGPNWIIEVGTVVVSFSGGNGNFTFTAGFGTVVAIIVSEGGGASDTVVGTTNYTGTGTGVYAIRGGAAVTGLIRVNYIVMGS